MKKNKPNTVKVILAELSEGGYHLFVNLKVNGKNCRFLIDTGASMSVLDKAYFEKTIGKDKLKTVKQETMGLHSATTESHFGKVKSIGIGTHMLHNFQIAAVDLSHVNMIYRTLRQPKIHGILGSDLMLKYKMIVDYGHMKITLP